MSTLGVTKGNLSLFVSSHESRRPIFLVLSSKFHRVLLFLFIPRSQRSHSWHQIIHHCCQPFPCLCKLLAPSFQCFFDLVVFALSCLFHDFANSRDIYCIECATVYNPLLPSFYPPRPKSNLINSRERKAHIIISICISLTFKCLFAMTKIKDANP